MAILEVSIYQACHGPLFGLICSLSTYADGENNDNYDIQENDSSNRGEARNDSNSRIPAMGLKIRVRLTDGNSVPIKHLYPCMPTELLHILVALLEPV